VTRSLHSLAGVVAGLISMAAYLPYAYDVIRGAARPNRATWLIWAIVGGLLFASYSAAAGGAACWVPLSDTLGPALIAVLAVRYGEGGMNWFDVACLTIAGFSVLGWVITGSPMISLSINLLLAVLGALPTLRSVYRDLAAEPVLVWCAFLISNLLNLLAVEHWNWRSGAYPVYAVLAAGLVNVLICRPALGRIINFHDLEFGRHAGCRRTRKRVLPQPSIKACAERMGVGTAPGGRYWEFGRQCCEDEFRT
jgi:hypothetical protein